MRILLRLLALLIVLFSVLAFVRRLVGGFGQARQVRSTASGHLVKDPICGTFIPEENALRANNEFFCSEEFLNWITESFFRTVLASCILVGTAYLLGWIWYLILTA